IGSFGTIEIGHKTEMGKVSQVMDMGNKLRLEKGLRPIELREILVKQDFWEFVIARNTQQFRYQLSQNNDFTDIDTKYLDSRDFKSSLSLEEFTDYNSENHQIKHSKFTELDKYRDKMGQIQYTELMKKFPHLIQSKRGKNGGTWAELYILLKILMMIDKDFIKHIKNIDIEIFDFNEFCKLPLYSRQQRPQKVSFIYVITDGEFYKIGATKNINRRIEILQMGNPRPLKLVYQKETPNNRAKEIEHYLHKYFSDKNILGEWFKLSEDDINQIETIVNQRL
ncbi:MAG TPA: GIY-YIG nuclease family protein, partial [Campylobacterales bacterium]|nr:GIY-YIG nuclease family protein [Campylobacterales bacterium]